MKLKKIFSYILTLSIIATCFVFPVADIDAGAYFFPEDDLYSKGLYFVNLDTDIVISAKNEDKMCYPASLTKIMTCIVTIENCRDLDAYVKVTYDATNEFWTDDLNKQGAATAGIDVGQTNLTYRDCLYGLMLASGCEVANVLAYNIGNGDISAFVSMMNKKAEQIGCKNTHFSNPHGLWEAQNYSTPHDLYLIAKYAYEKLPLFMTIVDTYEYFMPANEHNPDGYYITNYNKLICNTNDNPYYYEYAHGMKTGSFDYYWTEDGEKHDGFTNLVSTAKKGGFTYLLVSVGAPYYDADGNRQSGHLKDALTLYKWAFANFDHVTVMTTSERITQLNVEQGESSDIVTLVPASDFSTLLPSYIDIETIQREIEITAELNENDAIVAPIEKGEILGTVSLKLNNEVIATRNLVAAQSIERSQVAYTLDKINSVIGTGWFKACIAILAVLIVLSIVLSSIQKSRNAKEEARLRRRLNVNTNIKKYK